MAMQETDMWPTRLDVTQKVSAHNSPLTAFLAGFFIVMISSS